MEFSVFHSYYTDKQEAKGDRVKIWAPDTIDLNKLISHLFDYDDQARIHIEHSEHIHKDRFLETTKSKLFFFPTLAFHEKKKKKKVWLYAQSDTLAHSLYNISNKLKNVDCCFIIPRSYSENADIFLRDKGIHYKTFSASLLKAGKPDMVLMLNDWSKEPLRLISLCHFYKIPTICIQESIIDFGDRFKRMEHADYAFVQGTQTLFELKRDCYFITGNPRYETIEKIAPNGNTAVINCNFTYNINEGIREQWLDDGIEAAGRLGFNYLISQHPRDNGNLDQYKNVYRSNSASVHQLLKNASVLITRFSSLIHEAIIMGLPVIYYNPHQEKMKYDFNFNQTFLFNAINKTELELALTKIKDGVDFSKRDDYLARHCMLPNSLPSATIAGLISSFPFRVKPKSIKDYIRVVFYHPLILKIASSIRKLF